jgi:tetratricopeptide (TPR) repeat protein
MTIRFAGIRARVLLGLALPLVFSAPALAVQSPDDPGLKSLTGSYLAARMADVEKDVPNAARYYRTALADDPDNLFLLERALVLSASAGEMQDALGFAARLHELQPANTPARLVLGVEDIRAGRYQSAVERLNQPGSGVLADLTGGLLGAWSRFGESEVDQAIGNLDALKGEAWYEPFKLLHSGYILLAAGRTEDALERLGKAREQDQNAVRITEAYARALVVANRKDEAEKTLQEFLTRFPDNSLASAALDEIQNGKGHLSVATPMEGAAEALAGIGAAIGQEGGTEVAFLYLRLALYLDPDIAGGLAWLSLGSLLDDSNQGESAIEAYQSIPEHAPFRALGQLRAALALDRMDRTPEAETAFRQAIDADPKDIQTYTSYGNMLRGRERFGEAADIYSKAIALISNPGAADWTLFYFRGIAHERTKQWVKAEDDFRRALELSPDQPLVLNYLGYSLVDMGRSLEEAMEMIKKAVELRPTDGYIVDSLGWAYYRLGQYDKAVEELERAVGLRAEDPVINDHLGDAYWKAGRKLEAQFQWRHARDFGAEGEALELILKKIAEQQLIEVKKDASADQVQPDGSL